MVRSLSLPEVIAETGKCSTIHSTSLLRNERGLTGDNRFVHKRAEANRYGDLVFGALKICEVVLLIY